MGYRKVAKELKRHSWYEVRCNGSHHQFKHDDYDFVVTVPYHSGDLSIGVLKNISKCTGLSLR